MKNYVKECNKNFLYFTVKKFSFFFNVQEEICKMQISLNKLLYIKVSVAKIIQLLDVDENMLSFSDDF